MVNRRVDYKALQDVKTLIVTWVTGRPELKGVHLEVLIGAPPGRRDIRAKEIADSRELAAMTTLERGEAARVIDRTIGGQRVVTIVLNPYMNRKTLFIAGLHELFHLFLGADETAVVKAPKLPIDFFFHSLAEYQLDPAACIFPIRNGNCSPVGLRAIQGGTRRWPTEGRRIL